LVARRLEADGYGKYIQQLNALAPLLKGQRRLTDADFAGIDPSLPSVVAKYQHQAIADMTVPPPNLNIPGTDGLEREVKAYVERVDAMIASYQNPTTEPNAGSR
jgi:hypothetical protein